MKGVYSQMKSKKKLTILIADDDKSSRAILNKQLQEEYDIMEAVDGEEAIHIIVDNVKKLSAVLLDITMPKVTGFQVIDILQKKNVLKTLPVILISGHDGTDYLRKGYESGASGYITKPYDVNVVRSCVNNVVNVYTEKNKFEAIAIKQTQELKKKEADLKKLNANILSMLGTVIEFRELESNNHIKRVEKFTEVIAKAVKQYFPEYRLTDEDVEIITAASCMHDVGKIMIPDSILLKSETLTPDEYEVIKSHTTKGCEILDSIAEYEEDKYYKYGYEICRYHHERFDGSGYPENIKEDEIPISAQIVSVAEAFDTLLTDNVYDEGYDFEKAFAMIINGDCGMFSPKISHCFKSNKDKFEEIVEKYHA